MNTKPYISENPTYRGGTEIAIAARTSLDPQATLAACIMDHLAIACAQADGEDSAGRQRLRLMTPREIAQRACDIAAEAYAQFEERDWLTELPAPKPSEALEEGWRKAASARPEASAA